MNDVIPTFPLQHLPINAIMNTLKIMNHLEIIGISILSKKTKNLVKSLKLKTFSFHILVSGSFDVRLHFHDNSWLNFELYQVLENEPVQELGTPGNISISSENATVTWKNLKSVKELLDHFQWISYTSRSILSFDPNCERFSIESIHKTVKDFQHMCFTSENHEHIRRVLSIFRPATLNLGGSILHDGRVPKYISVQNFNVIRVFGVQIALNDLVVTNARSIHLTCDIVSIKSLNRFLKLWKKGSNPRLEYLFLRLRQVDFQEEELMKGLKYQNIPQNRKRLAKVVGMEGPHEIAGGRDIWRFDGTRATILIEREGELVWFILLVWHDHCIVK